jgi:hypothetical protein
MKNYQPEVCRYQPKPKAEVDNGKLRARGVTTGGVWGVSHPPNLSKRYSRRAKTKKRSGKTTENVVESYG